MELEQSSKPWFFVAVVAFAIIVYITTKMPM